MTQNISPMPMKPTATYSPSHSSISFFFNSHSLSKPLFSNFSLLFLLPPHYLLYHSSRHHSHTFSQNFKDHTFWSLKTRFKHYKLYLLKNSIVLSSPSLETATITANEESSSSFFLHPKRRYLHTR